MVGFIKLAAFRLDDLPAPSPTLFENTWAATWGMGCHHPGRDCRCPRQVDLAERVPLLYWCCLPWLAHCPLNCHDPRHHLHHWKDRSSEAPFAISYFPATGNPESLLPIRRDPLHTWARPCHCRLQSGSSSVHLSYHVKWRAMLWQHIRGLRHIIVELFSALGGGDDWERSGIVLSWLVVRISLCQGLWCNLPFL